MEILFLKPQIRELEQIEEHISDLESELDDFATTHAQEDASRENELSELAFKVSVLDMVKSKVQSKIDYIRTTMSTTARVFDVNDISQTAKKKIEALNNVLTDKKLKCEELKRKRRSIILDPLKKKFSKWFILVSTTVGTADATLAYSSFRNGSFTMAAALVAVVAIGGVISVSHLVYLPWIKKAMTDIKKLFRISTILILAFSFFSWIGHLRVDAAKDIIDISIASDDVITQTVPPLNAWAISIISFVLFASVLFLSLRFSKTRKERLEEQEHKRLGKEISSLKIEIDQLNKQKNDIEINANNLIRETRNMVDYGGNSIRTAKNMGKKAIIKYKTTYIRYSNGKVPVFFETEHQFEYDENIQFIKTPKPDES